MAPSLLTILPSNAGIQLSNIETNSLKSPIVLNPIMGAGQIIETLPLIGSTIILKSSKSESGIGTTLLQIKKGHLRYTRTPLQQVYANHDVLGIFYH